MTLAYNVNSYLTNITGAVPGATTGFTYDGTNRVRTITDSENYTVTFDYDALDRPVKITYPDGTFEQIVYKWLDPISGRTGEDIGRQPTMTRCGERRTFRTP